MNIKPGSDQKKWFVYFGDNHDGPFTVNDIQAKIDHGLMSSDDYVWAEDMVDWKMLKEVKAFEILIPPPMKRQNQTLSSPLPVLEDRNSILDQPLEPISLASSRHKKKKNRFKDWITSKTFLRILSLFSTGSLVWYLEDGLSGIQIRQKTNAISTLPDLTAEENRELRAAVAEPIGKFGPSVALALSRRNPTEFSFFISTNLPDGARFDIKIEGIPETLIGTPSASGRMTVISANGLAKTPPFHLLNGKPLPHGEYDVLISLSSSQPTHIREISKRMKPYHKTYFFGGLKDEVYDQQLKKYHDDLREKTQSELMEINQFTSTLEDQLHQTTTEFQNVIDRGKGDDLKMKKTWAKFHSQWAELEDKLNLNFEKWTDEWLSNEAFYGKLYSLVLQSNKLVSQTHADQTAYFEPDSDRSYLETRIAETASLAQSMILSLKAKTQLAEKIPSTANGMPQRDKL